MLRLLRGISSNNIGDYYCLNCFNSKSTDNELKKHERLSNKHDYCHIVIPKELIESWREIIKSCIYNLYRFRMYTKIGHSCQNNPEKSYTEKKVQHEPSGYSLSLIETIFIEEKIVLKIFEKN